MARAETDCDVFIVATEPSGDQLGAALAKSLITQKADISITAIGGPQLERAGLLSRMDIEGLAILGFVEGLKAYPYVLKKVQEATDIIIESNSKAVVLIDSWGFMVRVARRLKSQGFKGKIIKYVAPQVWAMRSGRAKILARHVDHLLSIWPMDEPYFEVVGLSQSYVGNPVFDEDYRQIDRRITRETLDLSENELTIGLFLGSRPSEIEMWPLPF